MSVNAAVAPAKLMYTVASVYSEVTTYGFVFGHVTEESPYNL